MLNRLYVITIVSAGFSLIPVWKVRNYRDVWEVMVIDAVAHNIPSKSESAISIPLITISVNTLINQLNFTDLSAFIH